MFVLSAYPELLKKDPLMNFFERSADAWIEPGKDNYFDSSTILRQFERLCKLLQFKKEFRGHQLEIIVDNARTHSALVIDVNMMAKGPGAKCPHERVHWKDENQNVQTLDLFDSNSVSKGLFNISKEHSLIDKNMLSKEIKLDELRSIVSTHPAFKPVSKLELMCEKFQDKIIWCPKYHCELNPIEGFWCHLKQFVRKHNDQNFKNFLSLIENSIQNYRESVLHCKLWNRFWECLHMYNQNFSYQEVLHALFGAKSSAETTHHKNCKNFNTKLK